MPPLSLIRTGIAWLKDAVRGVHLDPHWTPPGEESGEVDNLTERYSAKAFIAFQRRLLNGDRTGVDEWRRVINAMSPEVREPWQLEVDWRIENGELVAVLTPEQMDEVRANALANYDKVHAGLLRPIRDEGVDIATMNAVMNGTYVDPDDEDGLPAWPELDDEQGGEDMAGSELPAFEWTADAPDIYPAPAHAWPEDIEDADIGYDVASDGDWYDEEQAAEVRREMEDEED